MNWTLETGVPIVKVLSLKARERDQLTDEITLQYWYTFNGKTTSYCTIDVPFSASNQSSWIRRWFSMHPIEKKVCWCQSW
jgi:hypothetical protein